MSSISDAEVIPNAETDNSSGIDAIPEHIPSTSALHASHDVSLKESDVPQIIERMADRINDIIDDEDDFFKPSADELHESTPARNVAPENNPAPITEPLNIAKNRAQPEKGHRADDAQHTTATSNTSKKDARAHGTVEVKPKKRSVLSSQKHIKKTPADPKPKATKSRSTTSRKKVTSPVKKRTQDPSSKSAINPAKPVQPSVVDPDASAAPKSTKSPGAEKKKSTKVAQIKKPIDKETKDATKGITKKTNSLKTPPKAAKQSRKVSEKKIPKSKSIGGNKSAEKKKRGRKPLEQLSDDDDSIHSDGLNNDEKDLASEADDEEAATQESEGYVVQTPSKGGCIGNLACSSRDGNVQALLNHAVRQLGKYQVVEYSGDGDVELKAYIIGKETRRGWGLLRAVAGGVALVSEDWLSKSISEGAWADMGVFRSDRFGQSPRSVSNNGTNAILNGFRIKVSNRDVDASKIRKIVTVCGGRVAEMRTNVAIYDGATVVNGVVNVDKKWLADSVEAGVALDFNSYDVSLSHSSP